MIIKEASFKKLHGYIDIDVDFQDDVNIIIGGNGSGKTTILNAMAWMLSPNYWWNDTPNAYFLANLEFEEVQVAYSHLNSDNQPAQRIITATRNDEVVELNVSDIDDSLTIPIVQEGLGRPMMEDHIGSIVTSIRNQDQAHNQVLQHLQDLPGPLYLPLNRRWIEEPDNEVSFYRPRYRRPYMDAYAPAPISQVLDRAERTFRQEKSKITDLQERLINWITKESLDDARISELQSKVKEYEDNLAQIKNLSEKFLASVNSFFNDNKKELFVSQELELAVKVAEGLRVSARQLSSGELQILMLFAFLYFQRDNPAGKQHQSDRIAVFLDEPEVSLHLAWQRRYVESITRANTDAQFIIATHSPEIAGPVEDSAIISIHPK
ncbi:MAG: AAA family ATPase [Caldilineaceae bacterium SB0662_bin_9]|uniref:AAA family ATPase n=1 Tax=Caldilineaceae bacterium SB0662_bin_9 TaxID=2605258 RepID=A0A6B1DZR8_9CHLR|nr:AAA family ATPase [Caldilineaceae bacterium SB0662_bin_9]